MTANKIRIISAFLVFISTLLILNPQGFGKHISLQSVIVENSLEEVQTSLSNNLKMFATLSAIKAALAVIEGSTVGVALVANAQIDLGDMVQPAYDYLDFIWHLFLYAIFILSLYKVILTSGLLGIGLSLIGVGGLLFVMGLNRKRADSALYLRWWRPFFLYGAIFAYGIPVSLTLSAHLGQSYTQPLKDTAWKNVESAQGEITVAKDTLLDWSNLATTKGSLENVTGRITTASKNLLESGLYFISIVLFELLLIPFATLIIFSLIMGRGIKSIPGMTRR